MGEYPQDKTRTTDPYTQLKYLSLLVLHNLYAMVDILKPVSCLFWGDILRIQQIRHVLVTYWQKCDFALN